MATQNIVCDGPGPHQPPSGVLGTSDRPVNGMRCLAPACVPTTDPSVTNADSLRQAAAAALAASRTYVALAAPTAAQTTAQVKALSRQVNALARMALGQYDGTD